VRHDDGQDFPGALRRCSGVRQEPIQLGRQTHGVALVELPGHDGRLDALGRGRENGEGENDHEGRQGFIHAVLSVRERLSFQYIEAAVKKQIDIFPPFVIKISRKVEMKGFFKFLLTLVTLGSIFFLGFSLGKEKEKAKIPKFQEEPESHI
jgi:hypothetical protein